MTRVFQRPWNISDREISVADPINPPQPQNEWRRRLLRRRRKILVTTLDDSERERKGGSRWSSGHWSQLQIRMDNTKPGIPS